MSFWFIDQSIVHITTNLALRICNYQPTISANGVFLILYFCSILYFITIIYYLLLFILFFIVLVLAVLISKSIPIYTNLETIGVQTLEKMGWCGEQLNQCKVDTR